MTLSLECAPEYLERYSEDMNKLEKFVDLIWPYFKKMYYLDKGSLKFFNKEHSWSVKNYAEGTTSDMTLTEIIEHNKEMIDLRDLNVTLHLLTDEINLTRTEH